MEVVKLGYGIGFMGGFLKPFGVGGLIDGTMDTIRWRCDAYDRIPPRPYCFFHVSRAALAFVHVHVALGCNRDIYVA